MVPPAFLNQFFPPFHFSYNLQIFIKQGSWLGGLSCTPEPHPYIQLDERYYLVLK